MSKMLDERRRQPQPVFIALIALIAITGIVCFNYVAAPNRPHVELRHRHIAISGTYRVPGADGRTVTHYRTQLSANDDCPCYA